MGLLPMCLSSNFLLFAEMPCTSESIFGYDPEAAFSRILNLVVPRNGEADSNI
jgi:hypothetical protein